MDESYNKNLFTLSSLISDASTWLKFQSSWKNCIRAKNKSLKSQGRKQISRYHAADCSSRVNEFAGWTVDEQIELTKDLLKVFAKHETLALSYTMPRESFVQFFPECTIDPIGPCYSLLLKYLMLEMVKRIDDTKKISRVKPLRIVISHDRSPYDGTLLKSFNSMIDDPTLTYREMFSTIAPRSSKDCIPLQAADLLAYENFKESEANIVGRKRRKTLELLLMMNSFGGRARTFKPYGIRKLREVMDSLSGI